MSLWGAHIFSLEVIDVKVRDNKSHFYVSEILKNFLHRILEQNMLHDLFNYY